MRHWNPRVSNQIEWDHMLAADRKKKLEHGIMMAEARRRWLAVGLALVAFLGLAIAVGMQTIGQ